VLAAVWLAFRRVGRAFPDGCGGRGAGGA